MSIDLDKLRILLPHWIEHNAEHAAEFRTWAERADAANEDILAAAQLIESANVSLQAALVKLGGPLGEAHHHYHHEHDDD